MDFSAIHVLVERRDPVHEGDQLAEQFHPDEAAADDHEREESRFALRVGFNVGALEPLDDVVAKQQGVGEGLERKGVLRAGDKFAVGLASQGQVVGQLAMLPWGCQADHAPIQVDVLDGGLDETGGAQKGTDGEGAIPQVQGAREDLEQQRRHEQEVVTAHQDDFHVRPSPEEPL